MNFLRIFIFCFLFFLLAPFCSASVLYSNGVATPDRVYGLSIPFTPATTWRTMKYADIYLNYTAGHDCDVYFVVKQGVSTLDCTSLGGAGGHKTISAKIKNKIISNILIPSKSINKEHNTTNNKSIP